MTKLITILIPCRNEEHYISQCLKSVLSFELPAEVQIEILMLDGCSTDRTRELIEEYAARDERITMHSNPGVIPSCALNIGIQAAKGEWILRLDAHASYPPDYLRLCYETALRTGAENVGGIFVTELGGKGYSAQLVQALTTHRFGIGNSGFRTGCSEGPRDTVPYGFFRRDLFERIGYFDERLVRNQDYEFNSRIRSVGLTVWLNPAIRILYFNQATIGAFLKKQLHKEGPSNPYMWYLAPYAFTARHAITAFFTLGILGGGMLLPFYGWAKSTYIGVLSFYLLLAITSSVQQAARYRNLRHIIVLPFCFFAFHFIHGLGVLKGALTLLLRRAYVQRDIPPWSGAFYRRWRPKLLRVAKLRAPESRSTMS